MGFKWRHFMLSCKAQTGLWIVEPELFVYPADKSTAGNISVDNTKHLILFTYFATYLCEQKKLVRNFAFTITGSRLDRVLYSHTKRILTTFASFWIFQKNILDVISWNASEWMTWMGGLWWGAKRPSRGTDRKMEPLLEENHAAITILVEFHIY